MVSTEKYWCLISCAIVCKFAVIMIMCAIDFSRTRIVEHTVKYFPTTWITSVALVLHVPGSSSGQLAEWQEPVCNLSRDHQPY